MEQTKSAAESKAAIKEYLSRVNFRGQITLSRDDRLHLVFVGDTTIEIQDFNKLVGDPDAPHQMACYVATLYSSNLQDEYLHHPLSHHMIEKLKIGLDLYDKMNRKIHLTNGWISSIDSDSIISIFGYSDKMFDSLVTSLPKKFDRFADIFSEE